MSKLNKFIDILLPLISYSPSISILYSLMLTCKKFYIIIYSTELFWKILLKFYCCSFCLYQINSVLLKNKFLFDFNEKNIKFNKFYCYEIVKSIISQRKLRRQWGIIFTSQVYFLFLYFLSFFLT